MSETILWGLWDTVDEVWMGTSKGPKTYPDQVTARLSSRIVDVQLGQTAGRTKAKEYVQGAKRLRDQKDTLMSTPEAIRKIEAGAI